MLEASLIEYENMLKKAYDLSAMPTGFKFRPYETFQNTSKGSSKRSRS